MESTSTNKETRLSKIWPRKTEAVLDGITGTISYSDDHGNVRLERGPWKAKVHVKDLTKPLTNEIVVRDIIKQAIVDTLENKNN